jgi:ABC-type cobalamin/Fe3+-siderophores transport system ATPase subunit
MISTFRLKFGRSPGLPAEPVSATAVTVFVGPNNSGKSKVLSELERYCRPGQRNATDVILEDVEFAGLDADRASEAIERVKLAPLPTEGIVVGNVVVGARGARLQVPLSALRAVVQNPAHSSLAMKSPGLR